MPNKYIVTGGAGFIGSHLVDQLLREGHEVIIVDKMTYASSQWKMPHDPRLEIITCDVSERAEVTDSVIEALRNKNSKEFSIFHLAAESHVDRSIASADLFIKSNVLGTQIMLDICRDLGMRRFLHISTDEVYGSLAEGEATEEFPLIPSSAYAASKASSDLVALAHHKTFGTDVVVTRCVNNFGPRQSLEKFIPRALSRLMNGREIPIYGNGLNFREWIYVSEHCKYLKFIMDRGKSGEIYNIGTGNRKSNLEIANDLAKHFSQDPNIVFIRDRLGHDLRYALDSTKLAKEGMSIENLDFHAALLETINYYKEYATTKNYNDELRSVEEFYGN
jgi:dTDP-glucose 4,6-dehydratase